MENLIDPFQITDYNRTTEELQIFWLFCMMVAGKNATTTSKGLTKLLMGRQEGELPFDYLKRQDDLYDFLLSHSTGQYNRLTKGFTQSFGLDLHNGSVSDFEAIHGIGPKSARFFVLHSRKGAVCGVLDTHIMKYLQAKTVEELPKGTPPTRVYGKYEKMFLDCVAVDFPDKTVAEADLHIWTLYKRGEV